MGYIDNILFLQKIHREIQKHNTGKADAFAKKLGIKHTSIFRKLDELRLLGAKIEFDPKINSYYYTNDFNMNIQITHNNNNEKTFTL